MLHRKLTWLFALCALAFSVASALAADDRTYWKYDKGSFEKTADGKWVQKEGDKTYAYKEVNRDAEQVVLQDKNRNVTVWLKKERGIVFMPGIRDKTDNLKGDWATPEAPKAKGGAAPEGDKPQKNGKPDPNSDERTLWKYDKGTFEKQPDGKWVQKEGDTTHEYAERHNLPGDIEIFDAKRKISVRLFTGEAVVSQQGKKGALEKLKGEWVTADGSKLVNKFTLWKYEKGSFERQANGQWIQKEGGKTYTLREDARQPDHTKLYDLTRKVGIRITKDKADVFGNGGKLLESFKGEWDFTAQPQAKADPKARPKDVGRTAWQYDKGYFLKGEGNKWVHRSGKLTEEYEEVAARVGYIELQDKSRNLTIRLMRDSAMSQVGPKGKPDIIKGVWVDPGTIKQDVAPKGDPATKAESKFAEVAVLKRKDEAQGGDIAISPDGKFVARMIGSPLDVEFGIIEVETSKTLKSWKLGTPVGRLVWAADGKSLAALVQGETKPDGKPSRIVVWDTATWEEKASFDYAGFPEALAFSANGNVVATAAGKTDKNPAVKVWNVATKKEIHSQPVTVGTVRLALSADGKILAVSGFNGTSKLIGFFDLPSGKVRGGVPGGENFTLSADGNTVIDWAYGNDGLVLNVWNMKSATKAPRVVKAGKWKPDQVIFLNKDQHIAVSGGMTQDEVRVFELKTLKEVDSFQVGKKTPGRSFLYLKATPDSALLLTLGTDKTVRLWSTPWGPKENAPMPKEKDKDK